jgi:hypothetical protein
LSLACDRWRAIDSKTIDRHGDGPALPSDKNSAPVPPAFERGRSEPAHSLFLHDHLFPAMLSRIEEHVFVEVSIRLWISR